MATTIDEKRALNKCNRAIEAIAEELQEMRKCLVKDQIIYKLEDLCTMLNSAILHFNLNFPPVGTFERYLRRITDIDDLFHIMKILHQSWLYIHPYYLFERPLKDKLNQDVILDTVLSNYEDGPKYNYNADADRHNINELTLLHAKKYAQKSDKLKAAYGTYIYNLYIISKDVCNKFSIKLNDNFTISYTLISTNNLTMAQIDNVFKVVADDGMMYNDQDTAATFRALFESSVIVPEHKIVWLDTTKGHSPNYASLYTMFSTMGVEMDRYNRSVICHAFETPCGKIEDKQLKTRKTDKQTAFKAKIEAALRQ